MQQQYRFAVECVALLSVWPDLPRRYLERALLAAEALEEAELQVMGATMTFGQAVDRLRAQAAAK